MRALGIGDAFLRRQIAIIRARQYDLYMGEADGFQRDQMRDLQDYIFLREIVYADAAGVIAPVAGVYGDYCDRCGLACAPRPHHTDYQKPKTKCAHRLTDHPSLFIIQRYRRLKEIGDLFSSHAEVNRHAHDT